AALARFGIGFLEVGPVTPEPYRAAQPLERRADQEAVWYPDPPDNPGLEVFAQRLARASRLDIPVIVRLGCVPGATPAGAADDCRRVVERLAPHADLFSVAMPDHATATAWGRDGWREHVRAARQAARSLSPPRPLLACVPAGPDLAEAERLAVAAVEEGADGVLMDGGVRTTSQAGLLRGRPAREPALRLVRHLRQHRPDLVIVASGGVHEPVHALELFEAGANLVQVDSGLVHGGPGLPKRINEALLFASEKSAPAPAVPAEPVPPAETTWFWTLLLGISMLLGGMLALVIASTRVVLPYDEGFVGMTREQLTRINDRLLAFMAHDRVTLAGTMISTGVLYIQLSLFGIRCGMHWARQVVLWSAFTGFGSFFLFLGFGYFDPFHAFVSAILFQFLLLALHARLPPAEAPAWPNLRDDWRWRWSLWGQFLFIVQGFLYVIGGVVICSIGVTKVFVPEDLAFMQTTVEALTEANPRLVPLVAHDRASFGGMLIATGLGVLLPALWGYRQGARWLWWTFLAAGVPGYAAGIGVHLAVGYTDPWHLAPAFGGAAVFVLALVLSYPYLCQRDPAHEENWKRYLGNYQPNPR
ncbi:MAG TPA: hypothetical protein VKD72_29520, partial [Gemmataceae bacterium]|nr:hypothetical protein [Gemmataceae bacterium]